MYGEIKKLSATYNNVISCASSFNVPVTEAILRWVRATKTLSKPILLHLSGTGNCVDYSTLGS